MIRATCPYCKKSSDYYPGDFEDGCMKINEYKMILCIFCDRPTNTMYTKERITKDEWRNIPGFPGYVINPDGIIKNVYNAGRILKSTVNFRQDVITVRKNGKAAYINISKTLKEVF